MSHEELKEKEKMVDQYIARDKREEAVKLLFDLIVSHARNKNFEKAEALNEKLYNVDPMAITEIVRAAEAIEEARKQGLDSDHLQLWARLYESLSNEEGNALYYAMEALDFAPGKTIMEQGEVCRYLYFINKGEAKVVFDRDSEQLYLKTLGAGHVFGHETFFSTTVSTVSVIAMTAVKITRVHSDVLKKWKDSTPLLESRLYEFCKNQEWIHKELKEKGLERRHHSRIPVGGSLSFQLLDKAGKFIGKAYKGEMADISAGGVSFLIKTSRPESLRMLLGRRLRVRLDVNSKDQAVSLFFDRDGRITAVQSQAFDDYSIHLRFDIPLEQTDMQKIFRDAGR